MTTAPAMAQSSVVNPLQRVLTEQLARLDADPGDVGAWRLAAKALSEMGQHVEAIDAQRKAVDLAPHVADAWVELGIYASRRGVRDDPAICFRKAVELDPDHHDARVRLGMTLMHDAELDEAGACFAHVLQRYPNHTGAVAGAAMVLDRKGHPREAWTLLQRTRCHPNQALAIATSIVARHVGLPEQALPVVRKQRRQCALADRSMLLHEEGELYAASGDPERAWRAWSLANRDRGLTFDAEAHRRTIRAMIARTPSLPVPTGPSDERPVFVVGMPRSGTTLVESLLAAHSAVHGAGELEALRDLAVALPQHVGRGTTYFDVLDALPEWAPAVGRAYLEHVIALAPEGSRRIVDKMPNNALHLALVGTCLPGARIVWCERDDDDVALSCYRQALPSGLPWATSMEGIRAWQEGLHQLKAHWEEVLPQPIHTVRYEALVADPEAEVRRLCEYLGLAFEPSMLDFHRSGRAIATASWDQVREPIHARSVGRSKPFARFLRGDEPAT